MPPLVVENFRLVAATSYAEIGWCVVPLHWPMVGVQGTKCSCGKPECGSVGKHPLTSHGLNDASADADVIRAWWQRTPGANVGIATGADSGVVVVDVDPRDGGDVSLGVLCDEYGQLPETVEAETGGGGLHLFFRHPGGVIRNSAGKIGKGIDVRGDGGYVVAAPSFHASGGRYGWRESADPQSAVLAEVPEWLLKVMCDTSQPLASQLSAPRRADDDGGRFWLGKALARCDVGNRNDTGHWLACQLRDARVPLESGERLMAEYAARCPRGDEPYTEHEAVETVRCAYRTSPRPPASSRTLRQPKATVTIQPAPANAASELRSYLQDVVSGKVVDARLPWPLLSRMSCAMLPGSVTTLCGDPGVGKTFWTLECLRFWHGNGHDPAAFFIEKNRRFYSMRLLAQLEEDGRFVDHDWLAANAPTIDGALERYGAYIAEIGKCIHSSETGRVTLDSLLTWVRQMASAGKRVLIVDPLTAVNAGVERWVADDDFMVEASRICIAHGCSLVLVTHPKGGGSARKSGHDVGGGAAYFRFCDSLVWIKRTKKPRSVRVKTISPVGVKETSERCSLFFEMHKTRDGRGAGQELAYSFGDGLHFCEHGLVTGETKDPGQEAA